MWLKSTKIFKITIKNLLMKLSLTFLGLAAAKDCECDCSKEQEDSWDKVGKVSKTWMK